jgi:P27 family predicted phage terminase small subunit
MVTNPAVNAAAKYRQQLKTYVAELGLSPSSRTRLEGKGPDGEEESPFDV